MNVKDASHVPLEEAFDTTPLVGESIIRFAEIMLCNEEVTLFLQIFDESDIF